VSTKSLKWTKVAACYLEFHFSPILDLPFPLDLSKSKEMLQKMSSLQSEFDRNKSDLETLKESFDQEAIQVTSLPAFE